MWNDRPRTARGDLACIVQGHGPPVLLLHGVGLRAEAWAAQIDAISPLYTAIAPDLPGHGSSPAFTEQPALGDFTARIADILDAPAHVVGHSMGAMIGLDLAINYPRKVRSVTALNAIFRRDEAARAAVRARADAIDPEGTPDPAPTLRRWFGASRSDAAAACATWLRTVDMSGYRAAYRLFAHDDGPDPQSLSKLAHPALFATGAQDPNSTPEMSQAMARLAPHGTALVVLGAAHMLPMTHPDRVTAALLDHFSRTT